jgi:hypothetical protein
MQSNTSYRHIEYPTRVRRRQGDNSTKRSEGFGHIMIDDLKIKCALLPTPWHGSLTICLHQHDLTRTK